MRTFQLQTVIRNYSKFPIGIVWENAQDLEHVQYLHRKTNREFHLLYAAAESGSKRAYDFMAYRTVRRFYFWGLSSYGFRRIIADNHIQQLEFIPLLGITSTLNSILRPNFDPALPTLLCDEVILEVPIVFRFLRGYLENALHRHAAIQCSEDEPFRERRSCLARRGIRLPFSLFNQSVWNRLTEKFVQTPGRPTNE